MDVTRILSPARLIRIVVSALAVSIVLLLPTAASAATAAMPAFCGPPQCPAPAPVITHPGANYIGWGYTRGLGICPEGALCIWAGEIQVPAWRWSGAWTKTSVPTGTRVWIYPYATGWHWIWTPNTGWLAMTNSRLLLAVSPCWDYANWRSFCMY